MAIISSTNDSSLACPYPVFLNLAGKKCLIVGFGKVGRRKLAGLLASSPKRVLVLDKRPQERLEPDALALVRPPVHFECRSFQEKDLDDCFLAFGCTDNASVNQELAEACAKKNILCNCATNPEKGNFILPARARCGNLEAAFSSSGASPMLTALIRGKLEKWLVPYADLAAFLALLREELLKVSKDSSLNRRIFYGVLDSHFQDWLKEENFINCREWLLANVPQLSEKQIDDILKNLKNDIR